MELTILNHYNRRQFELMATKCQTNAETLQLIVYSQNNRIKEAVQHNEAETRGKLQQIIFGLAETYTTARLTDEEGGITENGRIVLAECMNLLLSKFKLLGIAEIQEAFRQAAAGEINANLNTYGKFTVTLFGGVLSAYKKKRATIRQKLEANIQLIEAQKDDERKAEKNEEAIQAVIEAYNQLKIRYNSGEEITLDEIPVHWYGILTANGVLIVSDTMKAEIYKQAKKDAILKLKTDITDTKKNGFQRNAIKKQLKTVLDSIANGGDAGDVETVRNMAIVLSKKQIVLQSIVNN